MADDTRYRNRLPGASVRTGEWGVLPETELQKEYDINGSLFLQADCKVSESRNLIIYGHNMNSGAMFGNLDFYADETYYQEHPLLIFRQRIAFRNIELSRC